MYIIYGKWKGDANSEIWEVSSCESLKEAEKKYHCYMQGFGNIYHLWVAEVN